MSKNQEKNSVLPKDQEVVISIRNAVKRFRLYNNPITGPIRDMLRRNSHEGEYYRDFVAVNDVSFDVRRGEVVGLLGANGSGKTTLLKMVAGLLTVDSGSISVKGKITALLALGIGIHPEFTGAENIYYNGILLGMSPNEIKRKTPEIIEFSELREFIEQPFRTYSSGMKARLLFAISMAIEPDILIVDEALATGDTYFVQKCSQRIREICESGATILFVSHNVIQIRDLCDRVILMDHGKVVDAGNPDDMIARYQRDVFSRVAGDVTALEKANNKFIMSGGDGRVRLTDAKFTCSRTAGSQSFYTGDSVDLILSVESELDLNVPVHLFVGFEHHVSKRFVGEVDTKYYIDGETNKVSGKNLMLDSISKIKVSFKSLLLLNNKYSLRIMFYDGQGDVFCDYRGILPFLAAREAHALSIDGPVFWQPVTFEMLEPESSKGRHE